MPKSKNRKNTAYKIMHEKCHTQNAVKNYQEKRKTEKKLHKKKEEWAQKEIEELKELHGLNGVGKFYRMISEARKGFTLTINMCQAKDGTMLSDQQDVLNCLVEQFTQ
jgi:hypothetical protein